MDKEIQYNLELVPDESLEEILESIKWVSGLEFQIDIDRLFTTETLEGLFHDLIQSGLHVFFSHSERISAGSTRGFIIASFKVSDSYRNLFLAMQARDVKNLVIEIRHLL